MKNTDDAASPNEGDQQFDVAARVTYDPILDRTHLLHFGVSGLSTIRTLPPLDLA